eukprot:NODE_75_length_23955_cov_0.435069.p26 type:complete len:106 gc:universal NODE_75_length_23955_cov_0.435069:5386-5069(-)
MFMVSSLISSIPFMLVQHHQSATPSNFIGASPFSNSIATSQNLGPSFNFNNITESTGISPTQANIRAKSTEIEAHIKKQTDDVELESFNDSISAMTNKDNAAPTA